jgi:23S rRNA pseudoU1915 N3-methylase RlmH
MANKKQESKKEIEAKEEARKELIQTDYKEYVERMEIRQLEVKPFNQWVRKAKKIINGETIEIEVSGDSGETKNQRFKRLGKARMIKALDALDMLINLSTAQYEATPEEVAKMINALNQKILDIKNSFESQIKPIEQFDF